MKQYQFFIFSALFVMFSPVGVFFRLNASETTLERFEYDEIQMGVPVRLVFYTENEEKANSTAKTVFESFKNLNGIMSDYDSDSELSRISQISSETHDRDNTASWIRVGDDLFAVLKASKHYGEISDGAFDITISPLVRLWRRSRRQHELPKKRYLEQYKELVGVHLWEIDDKKQSVRLLKRGMRFDLGGIAKGYAIDRAFEICEKQGISTVLIDAGGDIRVGTAPPKKWKIEIEIAPSEKKFLAMENLAMATSGDAFQYIEIDGVRYSHLIDPKTGLGLTRSSTVSVIAPTAMQADALASAVTVLGPEKGLKLIDTQKDVSAMMILHGDGRVFKSKNWNDEGPLRIEPKSQ